MSMEKAIELQKQIAEKEVKLVGLTEELGRSLALAQMWPDIWDRRKEIDGKVTSNWIRSHRTLKLRITLWNKDKQGIAEQRTFARPDVPECLDNPVINYEVRSQLITKRDVKAFNERKF